MGAAGWSFQSRERPDDTQDRGKGEDFKCRFFKAIKYPVSHKNEHKNPHAMFDYVRENELVGIRL